MLGEPGVSFFELCLRLEPRVLFELRHRGLMIVHTVVRAGLGLYLLVGGRGPERAEVVASGAADGTPDGEAGHGGENRLEDCLHGF